MAGYAGPTTPVAIQLVQCSCWEIEPDRCQRCEGSLEGAAVQGRERRQVVDATKWGLDKLDALRKLFTTGAWLPPALTPAE